MHLIDDNYVKNILESELYTLPLKEHKKDIIKKVILLIIHFIITFIITIISYDYLRKKDFYIKIGKPIFIFIILGTMAYYMFYGIKILFLLYKDYQAKSYEIVKDKLVRVRNSSIEESENNRAIISQLFLLEKLGEIKIGEFKEDLLYFRKRMRNFDKKMPESKEGAKSGLAIPYSIADSLYKKFEASNLPKEVYVVKSSGTKQIITILSVKNKTVDNKVFMSIRV